MTPRPRVGLGFDAHRFGARRTLVLGGVSFPGERGLAGHSDADVLAHAVADAVLGAAGLGDLGTLFPDTASKWRGASSLGLLIECARRARRAGVRVHQVDCTLVGESPRIAPRRAAMARNLARALGLPTSAVNVKGKTTERLGFLGRREGLAALAVAVGTAAR